MLSTAKFINNPDIIIEKKESWSNMKYNNRSVTLKDEGGISCFAKRFTVRADTKLLRAELCCSALGIFEVYANSKRIGNDELKPGWTDYRKHLFQYKYDITDLLTAGENELYAEVSNGWWSCRISFGTYGFLPPAFCCALTLSYDNGDIVCIQTDSSWRTGTATPIRYADIWDGEYYDARIARNGDLCTSPASISNDFHGEIIDIIGPTCKKKCSLSPISATLYSGIIQDNTDYGHINIVKTAIGNGCEKANVLRGTNFVLDFGQNIVGRPRIAIRAKKDTKITLYFGEFLNDSGEISRGNDNAKGSVYIKNYRSALSRVVYIANGSGVEEYAPLHTFYGYKYIELEADNDVEVIAVHGEVIGTDNTETATFFSSDSDVNKLYSNIVWGMRGNYLSIPTDCPQRDERLGWTGDTQIFCGAGSYLADIYDFMRKWLLDARDSQKLGAYCDVIPGVFAKERWYGNAAWGDAGIIVPFKMYVKYGNDAILREHYDSMEEYMHYLEQFGLEGANTAYGDWLSYEDTDKRYIAICYYAYTAELMEKISKILGHTQRAAHYHALHERIVQHFSERYIHNGELTEHSQTAYLLAIRFALLPHKTALHAAEQLRKKIIDNGYRLSTGFVGTGILCPTLTMAELTDIAYSLLLQKQDPSWLYSVAQGATTVWERWNSYTISTGFGNVEMNSFNHYAYGAVAEWLFETVCGIAPDEQNPGFSHFFLMPIPDLRTTIPCGQKRMTYASGEYLSAQGMIKSSWSSNDDGIDYRFSIPNGTSATVRLISDSDMITINGISMQCSHTDNTIEIELSSGDYYIRT